MNRIAGDILARRLVNEMPDNDSPISGYALVNVLSRESYLSEHIPGSINIPKGNEDEFEGRFAKEKEIIIYCESPDCTASDVVADELVARGFSRIFVYPGGMREWREAGRTVESGDSSVREMSI